MGVFLEALGLSSITLYLACEKIGMGLWVDFKKSINKKISAIRYPELQS